MKFQNRNESDQIIEVGSDANPKCTNDVYLNALLMSVTSCLDEQMDFKPSILLLFKGRGAETFL